MSGDKLDRVLERPLDEEKNTLTKHPILLTDSKGYSLKKNHLGNFPLELWAESSKTLENRIDVLEAQVQRLSETHNKQKRSTEGCSKFKSPETRQVQERLVSTLEHMQLGQDQVSGGVSVLCWHAAPVAYVLWKPCTIR